MQPIVTHDHNEVFAPWVGIEGATLVHIDAHDDLWPGAPLCATPLDATTASNYSATLSIANFIVAAAHYGIISDMYWLNPHDRTLYHYSPQALATTVKHQRIFWQQWPPAYAHAAAITPARPVILDVDLDAFACEQPVSGIDEAYYDGTVGYSERIDYAVARLKGLQPQLITVTRSQGYDATTRFVPKDLVEAVQAEFLEKLRF